MHRPNKSAPLDDLHCAPSCAFLSDQIWRCRRFESAPHLEHSETRNLFFRCDECKTNGDVLHNIDVFYAASRAPNSVAIIGTNATTKHDGTAVMGRGAAKQVAMLDPTFPIEFGKHLAGFPVTATDKRGKVHAAAIRADPYVHTMSSGFRVLCFMVKDCWWNDATLSNIALAAPYVYNVVVREKNYRFFLTQVGCGNGRLNWADVSELLVSIMDQPNVTVIM